LIDPEKDVWEKYEIILHDAGATNLLFGKQIKFDNWGAITTTNFETQDSIAVKFHKSEGIF